VTRFSVFLANPTVAVDRLTKVDRPLLERYLADLRTQMAGRGCHQYHLGSLNGFLRAIRQHRWDPTLPTGAVLFPEDFPKRNQRLPRALAEHVMAQVEQTANLDRWDNPAYRLVTLILMRCGLRVSDAIKLPPDCIVRDADGAPYLRYHNHKMKREALVPIDEELHQQILDQQQRCLQRWPARYTSAVPTPDGEPQRSPAHRGQHLPGRPGPMV
jgi:site-specific recombinase XerD